MALFSMALGAKKKPAAVPVASGFASIRSDEEKAADAAAAAVLVTEMAGGKTDADKAREALVIPGASNTFALGGAQHLRDVIPADALLTSSAAAPLADVAAAAAPDEPAAEPVPAAPVNEDAAAADAMLAELRAGGSSIFGADDTERYRRDVATRADSTSLEGYEATSIEDFGKAYLRGYGWQEAKDGGPEPTEYVPRPSLLGLGAAPKLEDKGGGDGSKKRFIKPGDSREAKKDMIYVDELGRQRHVKRVGDKLVEREAAGFDKGALVAVTSGPHSGLCARAPSRAPP